MRSHVFAVGSRRGAQPKRLKVFAFDLVRYADQNNQTAAIALLAALCCAWPAAMALGESTRACAAPVVGEALPHATHGFTQLVHTAPLLTTIAWKMQRCPRCPPTANDQRIDGRSIEHAVEFAVHQHCCALLELYGGVGWALMRARRLAEASNNEAVEARLMHSLSALPLAALSGMSRLDGEADLGAAYEASLALQLIANARLLHLNQEGSTCR